MFASSHPSIVNVALTAADTEYKVTVPRTTNRWRLQARPQSVVKLRFSARSADPPEATEAAGTPYWTMGNLPNPVVEDVITGDNQALYLESPDAGAIVEVMFWS